MTKSIRKYRSWFMAGFMILLMLAWLGAPASNGIGQMRRNRTVGSIDGTKISAEDQVNASKEVTAITSVLPGVFGIEERDATHWLLLSREAEKAGYVGETADGEDFMPALAREMIQGNFQLQMQLQQSGVKTFQEASDLVTRMIQNRFGSQNLTKDEMDKALARVRGVDRMLRAYRTTQRLSDREAVALAKRDQDAAVVDLVSIPASLSADKIADPDDAALAAHFDAFKATKPGEGDYGIGYLLPRRVKLEWLTLSREAFEQAATLDPVEVLKRYKQNHPGRYAGEYPVEKANVEKDMRAEAADKAMGDAQLIVQSEVAKATRLLENDGTTKYKKLPADWEQKRPRFEAIAQAVADEAKKSGLNIPLPEVTVRAANWLTEQDMTGLPGIGYSALRQGGVAKRFPDVVGWTRELPGSEAGLFPVQTNVPVGDFCLIDGQGNRYFINVLATRGESAPDSVADIKDLATKDYKNLKAFEALKGRLDEFKAATISGGLEAVTALVNPPSPVIADPNKKDEKKIDVRKNIRVTRMGLGDAQLNDESVRTAIVDAAAVLDPMAPFGTVDPVKGTLALAAPKHLSVGVFRIQSYSPLTREAYRSSDTNVVTRQQQAMLTAKPGSAEDPYSLASLLKRHDYVSNDEHIRTVDQLKRHDKTE